MNCIRGLKKVDLLVSNPIKISETPIPRSSMQWYHNTASILLPLGFIGLSLPISYSNYTLLLSRMLLDHLLIVSLVLITSFGPPLLCHG